MISPASNTTPSIDLCGSLTRQVLYDFWIQAEQELPLESFGGHVANVGRMIEEMEIKMRGAIQEVYFGKTKDILNDLRSINDLKTIRGQNAMQAQLLGKLQERKS